MAADGEAGGRPDGRARGPGGALPHRRPAARDGGLRARARPPDGLSEADLPPGYRELLGFRYGHAARNVLRLAGERPELAAPIVAGQPDLLAEAAIAARLEQARSVADVLLRRTRLGLVAAPELRTAESVAPVAEAIGASWAGKRTGCAPRPTAGSRPLGRRGSIRQTQ